MQPPDQSREISSQASSKIRPRKQFGQQIGPGTGNLTRLILPFVESLTAVEIDRDLCEKLRKTMHQKNFHLIEGSILDIPLPEQTNKVIANIPYNITGEILKRLLGTFAEPIQQFEQIVLLVQKEIGDRLAAKAGHKAYNALSVKIQYLADCQFICDVPAAAFYPPPKVNSAVIRIIPRPPVTPASDPKYLDRLLTMGFATKRKMLRNNLISEIDRDRLVQILESMGINGQVRAEDLDVAQWVALSEAVLATKFSLS